MRTSGLHVCLALLLLALGSVAACSSSEDHTRADNRCREDEDCPEATRCDARERLCASAAPSEPYELALQVSNLPAETSSLRRYAFRAFTFDKALDGHALVVPDGVRITGLVRGVRNGKLSPIAAEVGFQPVAGETGIAVSPVVVTSTQKAAEGEPNLSATLAPGRSYDVTITPLGEDSGSFPPTSASLRVDGADSQFRFEYPQLTRITRVLVNEDGVAQSQRWARIRAGRPSAELADDPYDVTDVVSSLAVADSNGLVDLYVLPDVLDKRRYELEVNLRAENPWGETINVASERVGTVEGASIVLPTVPERVVYRGSVEAGTNNVVPRADLTFESTFPVPDELGEVSDRDWCRAKTLGDMLPAFRCRARARTSTDEEGRFSVPLLPGDYRIFIAPNPDSEAGRRSKTVPAFDSIETQPGGGPQTGQALPLRPAAVVRGSVFGLSGAALANVAVRVVPLNTIGRLGEVAAYNRAADGTSAGDGAFELFVDQGYFDLWAEAPESAQYPWVYVANREIGPLDTLDISGLTMPTPVLVRGRVETGGDPVANAQVDAYAIVRDINTPGKKRAVRVASAVSDADGRYTLRLPPSVPDEESAAAVAP